jgi:hypothetical protein
MTSEQFCYWLQGFGDLNGAPPSPEQWKSINDHLALTLKKVTPEVRVEVGDRAKGGLIGRQVLPLTC